MTTSPTPGTSGMGKNTGTILQAATQQEMDEVINQLLESTPVPEDDPDDDTLLPIAPKMTQAT